MTTISARASMKTGLNGAHAPSPVVEEPNPDRGERRDQPPMADKVALAKVPILKPLIVGLNLAVSNFQIL